MRQRRLVLPLAYPDFRDLFLSFRTVCLLNRNQNKSFVIDENNQPVYRTTLLLRYRQFFLYGRFEQGYPIAR